LEVFATPIVFNGPGTYQRKFEGSDFGVVFEDDGESAYLYATNESFEKIYDALHLYDYGQENQIMPEDEIFIVWNPELMKTGFFYQNKFHAVFDFKNQKACCRSGFPSNEPEAWCKSSHDWDDSIIEGLE